MTKVGAHPLICHLSSVIWGCGPREYQATSRLKPGTPELRSPIPSGDHSSLLETEVPGMSVPDRSDDHMVEQGDLKQVRGLG